MPIAGRKYIHITDYMLSELLLSHHYPELQKTSNPVCIHVYVFFFLDNHTLSLRRSSSHERASVKHYRISCIENGWVYISPGLTFRTLSDLVAHYSGTRTHTDTASDCVTLLGLCYMTLIVLRKCLIMYSHKRWSHAAYIFILEHFQWWCIKHSCE